MVEYTTANLGMRCALRLSLPRVQHARGCDVLVPAAVNVGAYAALYVVDRLCPLLLSTFVASPSLSTRGISFLPMPRRSRICSARRPPLGVKSRRVSARVCARVMDYSDRRCAPSTGSWFSAPAAARVSPPETTLRHRGTMPGDATPPFGTRPRKRRRAETLGTTHCRATPTSSDAG